MKKIFSLAFGLFVTSALAQSGQKFATGGNSLGTGDFLGSTNSFPLIFKTGNQQKMSLGTNGVLQINNLAGTGSRLLQSDANGNIISFAMGNVNQYLAGNGTWISFPPIPAALWQQNSFGIFYNGKIGVNNSHPQFALDVTGDLNVTNNVYVGGAVLIGNRINAITEINSPVLRTDTLHPQFIKLDASRQVVGEANFYGDIIAKSKLNVQGGATFTGAITANGGVTAGSLNVVGVASFNQIGVNQSVSAGKIITGHISAPDTNGVHLGDSSMVFLSFPTGNPTYEVMRTNPLYHGIAIGTGAAAFGTTNNTLGNFAGSIAIGAKSQTRAQSSFVLGYNVQTSPSAIYAMAMGAGLPGCCPMVNNTPYSLAVGFNSDIPTFFVSSSSGQGTSGNVGIGTMAPTAKLEISAGSTAPLNIKNGSISLFSIDNIGLTLINTSSNSLAQSPLVITSTTQSFNGNPNNNKLFEITYRGAAYAREVFVQVTNFPDYVLNKTYKLSPLSEVEKYILANQHLKNMPTASEIEKDGANIGEIQRVSVEKIEELYLYMIELNKRVTELEMENKELKKILKK